MVWLLLQSLGLHLRWWLDSVFPGRHPGAPLGLRRLLFLGLFYPLFLIVQAVHGICLLLDELLFPGYHKVPVREPVFVTGIPRSGTTFVHRTLAADPRFTTVTSWEALLAPSILQRKTIRMLAGLDAILGRPLARLMAAVVRRCAGDFNHIHPVDPGAPEEDYLCLLPVGGCFILLLAFPFSTDLLNLGRFQQLPPSRRARLLDFYRRSLQKHLYCAGRGARLLSKNAAFATWVPDLRSAFPDASFLLCVRQPLAALSSQLSSLGAARAMFGTDPDGRVTASLLTGVFAEAYGTLAGLAESDAEARQLAFIDQDDLRRDPGTLLLGAVRQLGIDTPELVAALTDLVPAAASSHRHSIDDHPIDLEQIKGCHQVAYDTILASRFRVRL